MPEPIHNARCRARHLGSWAIEPSYLSGALSAIRAGAWKPRADDSWENRPEVAQPPPKPYTITPQGVALVQVRGAMMKGWSKFAECDTLAVRRAMREAVADTNARAIMLVLDSPGGSVPGTQELADDVMAARQVKPVHAFCEDLCASAAYWVASQSERLTVNALGEVGSIGVYAVLYDESARAEKEGVTVHVISTGEFKGAGVPGAPLPDAVLEDTQRLVDQVNGHFQAAIVRGRPGLAGEAMAKVATGQVWLGADAVALGLVDAVGTLDEAHAALVAEADRRDTEKRSTEMRRIAAQGIVRRR